MSNPGNTEPLLSELPLVVNMMSYLCMVNVLAARVILILMVCYPQ